MWPIPSLENELITISFSPNNLALSYIQKTDASSTPYALRAYKHVPLDNLELENLVLYNPSKIKDVVSGFLNEHRKTNSFIAFSLQGPAITEKLVHSPSSTFNAHNANTHDRGFIERGYQYLYPHDNGTFVFYTYAVARSLLLQYKLFAIATRLNLLTITTQRMALLNIYKHIFGPAFRSTQLAVDMHLHNNMIEHLITPDSLKRILKIEPSISNTDDLLLLATACGLFIQGTNQ